MVVGRLQKRPDRWGAKVRAHKKIKIQPYYRAERKGCQIKKQENRMQKRRATQRKNIVPDMRHAHRNSVERYLAYAQRLEEIRRL